MFNPFGHCVHWNGTIKNTSYQKCVFFHFVFMLELSQNQLKKTFCPVKENVGL